MKYKNTWQPRWKVMKEAPKVLAESLFQLENKLKTGIKNTFPEVCNVIFYIPFFSSFGWIFL